MNKRILGKDLEVTALGVGCMGLSHAVGAPTEEAEAVRFLHEAVEVGYAFFDTAETYGFPEDPHHNEKLVGEAFRGMRDQVVIASKFGVAFDYAKDRFHPPLSCDSRPETIRHSIEGTLRRLQTDHVDLYYQHRIDPEVEPEVVAEVVGELIREGKVLHWQLGEEKSATPGQLSLAWLLAKRPYVVPIPGMRRRSRLEENAGAVDVMLTAEEMMRIDALSEPLQRR